MAVATYTTSTNKQIFFALLSLASASMFIRMMNMLNQVIISARFGAGATMDAYLVATTLPTILAQLIISAVESAVIPVYIRTRTERTAKQTSILFSTLVNLLFVGVAALTVIMLLFRHQVIFFSAPALDPFRANLAVDLAPFIFPVMLLMVIVGFLGCVLNAEGRFSMPAYVGLIVPLTIALLTLLVGASEGIIVLCIAALAGLCLQLCVIIIIVQRAGLVYRPVIHLRGLESAAILTAFWPVLMGGLISEASPLTDQIFASYLSAGSISALSYALKLFSAPASIIFVSVGRAVLPYLSRQASNNDIQGFKGTLRLYVWIVSIITLALSVFMFLFAQPLVRTLFQHGAFSVDDTDRTAKTLIGFVFGMTPMALGTILSRAYSALGRTRILMYIAIFFVTANAVFDAIFAHFWQGPGIALATTAVYTCSMAIQFFVLHRIIGKLHLLTPPPELVQAIQKILTGEYYRMWVNSTYPSGIPYLLHQHFKRISIAMIVFALGVVGVFVNALDTLRVALGSIIVLILLRSPYLLLLAWALINGPNSAPVFRGSNILTGLTVPTLLLLSTMPVKKTFKHMPALAFLSIYLLWVLASIGISAIGVTAFLTQWILFLDCMVVAVLTINVLTTHQRLIGLTEAILFIALFIALYGIYGYFTRNNVLADSATSIRIYSIMSVPPTLAMFLSLVIPLGLYRMFTTRNWQRIYSLLVTGILLGALGLTFTRGAYIGVALSILILLFFLPSRNMKMGLLSGIVMLAILAILLETVGHIPLFSRFLSQDVSTLDGRIFLWQAILDHFDPTHLLGNGLNASNVLLTNLQVSVSGFGQGAIGTSPHSLLLGTLYDHGIMGVILLVLTLIAVLIGLISGIRKATGEHRVLFTAALAVFVSVLIQSLDSNDFWSQPICVYIWVIVALPFARCWFTSQAFSKEGEISE